MPRPYSMDLRSRVVAAVDAGGAVADVATQFDVSQAFVRSLLQRRRETGSVAARVWRPGPKAKLAGHEAAIREAVARQPDATLLELREQLPVHVSISTLWCALQALGLAFKKSPSRRRATAA